MDLDRIERALREGPVDEPAYVPGAFRRPGPHRLTMALTATAVVAALGLGVVIGLGFGLLRMPGGLGGPPDPAVLAEDLQGSWTTGDISRDDWLSYILAAGHDINDVDPFLEHDPIEASTRYLLEVEGTSLSVSEVADGGDVDELSEGTFVILPDGRLSWHDSGEGEVSDRCEITMTVDPAGDRLRFGPVTTSGCSADERIAASAFFNVADYGPISP